MHDTAQQLRQFNVFYVFCNEYQIYFPKSENIYFRKYHITEVKLDQMTKNERRSVFPLI